jgi:hypothetical protein
LSLGFKGEGCFIQAPPPAIVPKSRALGSGRALDAVRVYGQTCRGTPQLTVDIALSQKQPVCILFKRERQDAQHWQR